LPQDNPENNNDVLNALGNSLLGMFASEHLAHKFPLLPTEILKMALTAYVGPVACVSVARELGVGVRGGADAGLIGKGRGSFAAGIPVRWKRNSIKIPRIPISSRFRQFKDVEPVTSRTAAGETSEDGVVELEYEGESSKTDRSTPAAQEEKVTFDKVVAATVRAFIGLIYQEQVSAEQRLALAVRASAFNQLMTVGRKP
jgi:large subunit ribosomal protein L44